MEMMKAKDLASLLESVSDDCDLEFDSGDGCGVGEVWSAKHTYHYDENGDEVSQTLVLSDFIHQENDEDED